MCLYRMLADDADLYKDVQATKKRCNATKPGFQRFNQVLMRQV